MWALLFKFVFITLIIVLVSGTNALADESSEKAGEEDTAPGSESSGANCMSLCLAEKEADPYDCEETCVQVASRPLDLQQVACR